jgi:hypothetical protein
MRPSEPLDHRVIGPGTLDHLSHHGQPHGQIAPIQQVFGFGRDVRMQTLQRVGSVGQE